MNLMTPFVTYEGHFPTEIFSLFELAGINLGIKRNLDKQTKLHENNYTKPHTLIKEDKTFPLVTYCYREKMQYWAKISFKYLCLHLTLKNGKFAKKKIWNLPTTNISCRAEICYHFCVDNNNITESKIHFFCKALSVSRFLLFILKAILQPHAGIHCACLSKFMSYIALKNALWTLLFSTLHIIRMYRLPRGYS